MPTCACWAWGPAVHGKVQVEAQGRGRLRKQGYCHCAGCGKSWQGKRQIQCESVKSNVGGKQEDDGRRSPLQKSSSCSSLLVHLLVCLILLALPTWLCLCFSLWGLRRARIHRRWACCYFVSSQFSSSNLCSLAGNNVHLFEKLEGSRDPPLMGCWCESSRKSCRGNGSVREKGLRWILLQ